MAGRLLKKRMGLQTRETLFRDRTLFYSRSDVTYKALLNTLAAIRARPHVRPPKMRPVVRRFLDTASNTCQLFAERSPAAHNSPPGFCAASTRLQKVKVRAQPEQVPT